MNRMANFLFIASLVCIALSTSAAQAPRVNPGTTIRFHVGFEDSARVGQIAHLTSDSLILQRCEMCDRLRYGRGEINHVETYRHLPRGPRMVTGFGLGGLAGLGLGLIAAASCHGIGDSCDGSILYIPLGGILGGAIGSLVGYLTAYRWDAVSPP